MKPTYASLIGWGHYAPERIVTNEELSELVGTTPEWIESRSGIRQRHFVRDGEATSHLSIEAARRALARADVDPEEIDLLLVATSSPDYRTPPISSQVQHALGATRAGAMTLGVGCSGFMYGLVTAEQFIKTGAYRTVLVVGAEIISRDLDLEDRATCVLFGDGAGAVVLQATDQPCGMDAFMLGSDGSGAEAIIAHAPGSANPISQRVLDEGLSYLRLDGGKVFRFATRTIVNSLNTVLEQAGMTPEDIDLFIPHQANARIIDYAARQFGLPEEKVVKNLDRYGNTSAASIPIALSEVLDEGRAQAGDTLALVGFGAGLTWAAALFTLGSLRSQDRQRQKEATGEKTALLDTQASGDGMESARPVSVRESGR